MPMDKREFREIRDRTVLRLAFMDKQASDATKRFECVSREVSIRLRNIRKEFGVSLREISKRLGLSAAYVSDVELGRRKLTVDFADRFVEALAQQKRKGTR